MDDGRIRADLAGLLGAARVRFDDQTLIDHAHDWWALTKLRLLRGTHTDRPACVVTPATIEEVAAVLRYADDARIPVVPFGAGSGVCGGVLPSAGSIVVDLRGMNRLLELNETALTAHVEAGMMGDQFEAALGERGYSMGNWPQSVALSTLGGWIATRAAGQYSTRYGAIEDMVLGLRAVLAGGRIVEIKATPRRSAGPDLRHLFLGSEGTLGIVTDATVRVFPLPESTRLLCFAFADFDAGLEAIRRVVRAGWRPPVLRLYDAMETGRHFSAWAKGNDAFLIAVTEGPETMVAAEADACEQVFQEAGGRAVGREPVQHWLKERNSVPSFESFLEKGFVLDTIEVAAGWDRIHDLYREVIAAVGGVKDLVIVSGHSSHSYTQGTNIYFTFVARPEDPAAAEATYWACWERTMEATLRTGGTIAHHHGIGRLRTRWMAAEHGEGLVLLRAVKRALDPHGIMNPGALLPPDDG